MRTRLMEITREARFKQKEGSKQMTTPPAGLSISHPQAYRGNLTKLLGDRNPLEILTQTAATLAGIVRKHSATNRQNRHRG